jgi:Protein of unknown function (DUF2934)
MADTKDRRSTPRKAATATPKPDTQGATPRSASTPASAPMTGNARAEISSDDIRRQIAEAAYLRAKERGFQPGHELEDWVEAESEVMGRINGSDR